MPPAIGGIKSSGLVKALVGTLCVAVLVWALQGLVTPDPNLVESELTHPYPTDLSTPQALSLHRAKLYRAKTQSFVQREFGAAQYGNRILTAQNSASSKKMPNASKMSKNLERKKVAKYQKDKSKILYGREFAFARTSDGKVLVGGRPSEHTPDDNRSNKKSFNPA